MVKICLIMLQTESSHDPNLRATPQGFCYLTTKHDVVEIRYADLISGFS